MACSDEFIEKYSWMIRPCSLYEDEYSDCTSFRSRFYQHFIFGKFLDCGQWKHDENNCYKWREKQDKKAFEEIINNELARRKERLTAHIRNDVWEKRTEPPQNWNPPLPPHIEERMKNSYLSVKAEELKGERAPVVPSMCVIS